MTTISSTGDRRRRLYAPVLLVGLLAAIGMVVGASRPWASATSTQAGLPTITASASGTDLAPAAAALGVVVLAAFGAVVATRGVLRRAIGVLVVVASVVVLVSAAVPAGATDTLTSGLSAKGWSGGPYSTSTQAWRWLVLACSLATAAAGVLTVRYGGHWAVMGSRYDAPQQASKPSQKAADELSETEVWQALDQGRDPTREP